MQQSDLDIIKGIFEIPPVRLSKDEAVSLEQNKAFARFIQTLTAMHNECLVALRDSQLSIEGIRFSQGGAYFSESAIKALNRALANASNTVEPNAENINRANTVIEKFKEISHGDE